MPADDSIAGLTPLFRQLVDLKRIRAARLRGSLMETAFARSWAALVAGTSSETVALRETSAALIAMRLAGLDLAQMLLGEPVTEVAAFLQHRVHDYAVDDGAVLSGRTAGGVLLSHAVAYNCPDVFPRRTLEVIGTEGRAFACNTMEQDAGGTLTLTGLDGEERLVDFCAADRSPFAAQIEAFSDALRTGAPFPFPPSRDLHTMRLLGAAVRSTTLVK